MAIDRIAGTHHSGCQGILVLSDDGTQLVGYRIVVPTGWRVRATHGATVVDVTEDVDLTLPVPTDLVETTHPNDYGDDIVAYELPERFVFHVERV